ncbi:squalene monooxygenase-like [Babylonia areolata]|uniref:squalene monooxygenase-like n=1 Tax=Babylonia areolata TaxID=304850 RepID=UPI003FD5564C
MHSKIIRFGEKILTGVPWQLSTFAALGACIIGTFYMISYYRKRKILHKLKAPSKEFKDSDPEIVIIGSGVAGSALATVLARDGRRVTVIERDLKEPDRIVGELLQPGGLDVLERLGMKDCVEGFDAHMVKGYVIHNLESSTQVHIPYPETAKEQKVGRAFHHGRFIMALRHAARQEKNIHYIEGTATQLIEDNGVVVGVQYRQKDNEKKQDVFAPLTIVVDGCFSKFRKELVKEPVRVTSHFVGALMHNCPQVKANHAELVLSSASPVLIYQISSSDTRVLVDIRGQMPRDLKGHLLEHVLPQLPDHIKNPFQDSIEKGRVRSMPNSFLPPSPMERPGVLVLGDAFNMRHPLTGGGMSVALNDVAIWRELLRPIADLRHYEEVLGALRVFHLRRKNNHSFVVNVLAQALYELFAANNEHLQSLKRACFDYFKLGGQCVSGPIGLLSVLSPKPHILIGHFFAVALYAVFSVVRSERVWGVHRAVYRSFMIFASALQVIVPLIWTEVKSLLL